jgi:anti-sigma B factor antagonist
MSHAQREDVVDGSACIEVAIEDGIPVVVLIGDVDVAHRDDLRRHLVEIERSSPERVVLDLTQATFIDSTVLGAMVAAHRNGLSLTIRGANGLPERALELTGLAQLFDLER